MSRKNRRKKKNSLLIIIVCILIFCCLLVGGYFLYKDYLLKNKMMVVLIDDLEVQVNSDVKLLSFVDNVINGEIVSEDMVVDTSKLGKQEFILEIKNKFDEIEEYKFSILVKDTISPVIESKDEMTIYVSKDVDLLKDVKVTDNSEEDILIKVTGEYDIDKVGEYKLKYVAEDSSGNIGDREFTLKVVSDPNNRTFKTSKGYNAVVKNGVTYIDGILIANKSYSLPSNYGNGLTSETLKAFNLMKADSQVLGLNLYISSGYRSYYDQRYIYNGYVNRDGQAAADRYSARAGHSEHQTGLAFDLNTINASFANTPEGKWVADNCYKYGLILRYPKGKEEITGYMYESWHLRYVGVDLATKLYNDGNWLTLEEYFGIDSKYS